MSAVSTLQKKLDEFEAKKKEFLLAAQGELKKAFAEIFEQVPDIQMITWVQYTPYFNDGEPCEFSVHDVMFATELVEDARSPYDYEDVSATGYSSDHPAKTDLEKFSGLMASSEELLKDMFGDHVWIKVTREGIQVDEYDHE